MLERLAKALQDAGIPAAAEELQDILWLAERLVTAASVTTTADGPLPHGPSIPRLTPPTPAPGSARAPVAQMPVPLVPIDMFAAGSTGLYAASQRGHIRAGVIWVPGVSAAPMRAKLRRALQPFARRVPSATRWQIDEEATAERRADTGLWQLQYRRVRERWFDLQVVVEDDDAAAHLWQPEIDAFLRGLKGQGGFRSLQSYTLSGPTEPRLTRRHGGPVLPLSALAVPGQRPVTLVLTMGSSALWHGGAGQRWLWAAASVASVTVLQLLPRRAWRHTPLGAPVCSVHWPSAGLPNTQLRAQGDELDDLPGEPWRVVPMIGLDEASLRRWAHAVTAQGGASLPGTWVAPQATTTLRKPAAPASAAECVAHYRLKVSPAAYDLAVFLSVADPLTVPVMRLVQRTMLPDSGTSELAEFFLGGLLEPVASNSATPVWRLRDGVREELIRSLRYSEEHHIAEQLRRVGEALEQADTGTPRFEAWFPSPEGGAQLSEWTLPFATAPRAYAPAPRDFPMKRNSDAWQLVAHPDVDVCGIAELSVQRAFRQQKLMARVDSVANIAEAWQSLVRNDRSKLDLVVIASTMPPDDDNTSVGFSSRDATKQFIKELKNSNPRLPVIVVASTPDERLAGFLDAYDQTGLVILGSDFAPSLVARILALRAETAVGDGGGPGVPARARRDDSWIHLDIHLGGHQYGSWQMTRVGADEFEAQGTLQVDKHQLSRVIKDSKRLDDIVANNDDQWFEDLKELSNDLRELLFRNGRDNIDLWDRFLKHRERVGGVSHSRIRVTVDDTTHAILFEALRDSKDTDDEFWALNAPVSRRYAQQMALPPLFKEKDAASRDKPINCLIIEADSEPGVVVDPSGADESFPRLRHLKGEAEAVEAILRRHAGGKVERLSLAEVDGDLRACVVAKLGELQWHVVHFCGHVSGDAEHAGLVLRADATGVLPVKKLADALTRTQLLFLSSCRSASTRIVMHAVERLVSAVVGYQWVIDDHAASEFAIGFYEQLFSTADAHARDLEYALLKARRKIYKQHPEHPSWVAPVLVMNMG